MTHKNKPTDPIKEWEDKQTALSRKLEQTSPFNDEYANIVSLIHNIENRICNLRKKPAVDHNKSKYKTNNFN
jgi:hypothetical protein